MNFKTYLKNKKLEREAAETSAADAELELDSAKEDFAGGLFINSLEEMTEVDIGLSPAASAKKGVAPFEIARRIMFWICLTVFVISCLLLVQNMIDKQRSVEIYAKLQEEFFSSGFNFDDIDAFRPEEGEVSYLTGDSEGQAMVSLSDRIAGIEQEMADAAGESAVKKNNNEVLERMRAGIASLAQINPDIYGWISVEGTTIDYPLVQGEDNDYYLNHAYTGEFLPNGSIFVDYRNYDDIMKNFNTVMYGHNITSGAMFHDVTKFFKDEYFENVNITIYTDDGIYIYEPFSVYETRYDYNYFRTSFTSAEEFIPFAEEVRDNSSMKSKADMTFTANDRILTLSTCTNGAYYARYALHAKLVKTVLE